MVEAAIAAERAQGRLREDQAPDAIAVQGCPGEEQAMAVNTTKGKEEHRREEDDVVTSQAEAVGEGCEGRGGSSSNAPPRHRDGLVPPAVWPSFTLKSCADTLQVASQESGRDGMDDAVAGPQYDGITAEENERELQFAIAAGDVPAIDPALDHHEGSGGQAAGANDGGVMATTAALANDELHEGGLARSASTTEGHEGLQGQSNLKHRLK